MRSVRTLFFVLTFALGLASCAHLSGPAGVALRVESNVPDATIWVDDVLVGTVAAWAREGRHIHAGFHRVEIRAPGYYSVFQEIERPDGGQATLAVTLRPLLE
ncbi:MAG TPA: PEGA domain-containing protein [Polyangia bacterium]|nr:PEGA domain-containing protein [Polyangia bacterium]